jgi:predicted PurR-regulated permease PerM
LESRHDALGRGLAGTAAMMPTRQMLFWALAIAVFALVLWLLREILLPFVAGMAIAYLFDPLANRLERLGVRRLIAALLIVGIFALALLLLGLLIAPILIGQLSALIAKLPEYIVKLQAVVTDPNRPWLSKIVGEGFLDAQQSTGELVKQGVGWLAAFLASLWAGGRALISILSLLVVTPVVAFYFIYDWPRMVAAVDSWVPRPHQETMRALGREINATIAGFVRGQSGVCLILGAYYAVALTVAGLNFGLLIGLIAGVITFIPYVGSLTGLIVGLSVAVAQFWPDYTSILIVLGIFLVGQFVEGNVLSPKLVGESVGLHPLWLIFALFAFAYLFGFVGLLLAVPLAAAAGVLVRFALRQYLASPLYTGAPAPPAEIASSPRKELR